MGEEIARADELRDRFYLARKRLEAIPKTGISADGQPYIREVAEALESFAEWFGEKTLDEMSLNGSAYKVHDTLNGLDAIADWVGLHHSQQFAADIREHVGELVEQSEALDAAVSAAFVVKQTEDSVEWSRSRDVPELERDAIEDRIQSVASLAGHLAVRLQRIVAMTASASTSEKKTSSAKQAKRRDRPGAGGRTPKWSAAQKRQILAAREQHVKQMRRMGKPPQKTGLWRRDWATEHAMTVADARLLWQAANRDKYR